METIHIARVRVDQLCDLAAEALANRRRFPFLPITEYRARSQAHNPAARPDDVALLLAYRDSVCIGYLGILYGRLRAGDRLARIAAFSTWYVEESQRPTGAGAMLMTHALGLGHDYYVTGLSDTAERYYRAMGWSTPAEPLRYLKIRVSRALPWMSLVARVPAALRRPLTAAAWAVNRLVYPHTVLPLLRPRVDSPVELRPVSQVTEAETADGPRPARPPAAEPRVHRDAATVNWMLRYPWIVEDPALELPYAFSYRRERFRYLAFQIRRRDSGVDSGYAVFQLSGSRNAATLKIVDVAVDDSRLLPAILDFALRKATTWRIGYIVAPIEFQDSADSSRLLRLLTVQIERTYFLRPGSSDSPLGRARDLFRPSFSDSDMAFV